MPTLSLLTPATHPDGWHQIGAPGGFESWHFDANSSDRRVRIVVEMHHGDPMSPPYLRRYARYRALPTRLVPPLPREHPSVTVELFEDDRLVARLVERVAAHDFAGEPDGSRLRVGASHVELSPDGKRRLRARVHALGRTVALDLMFTPLLRVTQQVALGPHHHWVLCDPLHDVEGEVQLLSDAGGGARVFDINGRGYHDHRYGTRPLAELSATVFRGRALLDCDGLIALHQCGPEQASLVEIARDGQVAINVMPLYAEGSARTDRGIRYPLDLPRPRVIDSIFRAAIIRYSGLGPGEKGTALCKVESPGRASWLIR